MTKETLSRKELLQNMNEVAELTIEFLQRKGITSSPLDITSKDEEHLSEVELNKVMKEIAGYASEVFQQYGGKFDFSEDSLPELDFVVNQYRRCFPKGIKGIFAKKTSYKTVEMLALLICAYLGEVINKELGGVWYYSEALGGIWDDEEDEETGEAVYRELLLPSFYFNNGVDFEEYHAHIVEKRIRGGEVEDLCEFYKEVKNSVLSKREKVSKINVF